MTTTFRFDDRAISWRPFRGPDGLSFWVLEVNETKQKVDILFRLAPLARCVAHNHVGPTTTFVVDGEHRTYRRLGFNWALDEVRVPGTFVSHDGDAIHIEEGGTDGAIVHLSMQAIDGVIWTVLDDAGNVSDRTTVDDFSRAYRKQIERCEQR